MPIKPPIYYLASLIMLPISAIASLNCDKSVAQILSAQGKVDAQPVGSADWLNVQLQDQFCPGDKIRTAKHSRATIKLNNESIINVEQATTLLFPEANSRSPKWLVELMNGILFIRSRQPHELNIRTPFVNAVHEGTEFMVSVNNSGKKAEITVFDGRVAAQNAAGKIIIAPGQVGIAELNRSPRVRSLEARPEDAVQWALFYPPLVDLGRPANAATPTSWQHGDLLKKLDSLDSQPLSRLEPSALTLKTALLLFFGRADEAQTTLDELLKRNPDDSDALALRAVIAVSKNHQDEALALANKAAHNNPHSGAAQLALSYAYQAVFKLDDALASARAAIRLSPSALSWARLSELELSQGNLDAALQDAEKAHTLNPQFARTQTLLGFAQLSQRQTDQANASFSKAIALDASDPLAWLGAGLADIRVGNLAQGTQKLETAVSLDPNSAVIRSYLGKAHYELKNPDYAASEFNIAKNSDPKDPTPWFYDAILKQTNNRPVEALQDMDKAVALNDNRAVYRSRLLLDKDTAVRGTGLGRIYNDLGFADLANRQAIKSLAIDPGNYSAQRLLADSAANQPSQEITRASAMLQAQLFQPINLNPIQPRLAYTDLNIARSAGPAEIGFNEYNKVFERDNVRLTNTTSYGSNNTVGNEAVVSGLAHKFAYSLGQLHYDTAGYRANSGVKNDVYNAFALYELSPKWNIQAEYRRRDTQNGELELNGAADAPRDLNYHRNLAQDTYRLGLKFSPASHSDWVTSFIYAHRKEFQDFNQFGFTSDVRNNGYQLESAYLYRQERFNIITGAARHAFDVQSTAATDLNFLCPFINCGTVNSEAIQNSGYSYANIKLLDSLTTTLGLSYDDYHADFQGKINVARVSPKFGLLWQANSKLLLRMAVFETVKSPIVVSQIVQPLQVAGFNQFFDDTNGTRATQYGMGLDFRISSQWFTGLELFKRELTLPQAEINQAVHFRPVNEDLYRWYLNWTINDYWIANASFRHESYFGDGIHTIKAVNTSYLPTSLRFFHPNGFFAEVRGTYVNQSVQQPTSPFDEGFATDFYLVDASVGYRLPKQYGILSLEANNLLDNRFKFRDRNFQTNERRVSDITPEQTLFARFTFNF